ncbi:hypothetical protein HanIR_Chr12g0614941 [Helianthus annuus]|nr:hypothetical protein HanIR_Chr12g0614941 [Helianthus annuus]
MPKKLDFSKPEFAHREFGIEFLVMQEFENTTKVFLMVSLVLRVDKNVVDENDDKFV